VNEINEFDSKREQERNMHGKQGEYNLLKLEQTNERTNKEKVVVVRSSLSGKIA